MSWWETSSGNTIGDKPADIFRRALQSAAKGSQKPTVPQLLGAAAAALKDAGQIVSDDGAKPAQLTAVVADGSKRISGVPPASAPVTTALRGAFEEIARAYVQDVHRKPTVNELLESMTFVLRYKPDELLSGIDGGSIGEIVIDSAKR